MLISYLPITLLLPSLVTLALLMAFRFIENYLNNRHLLKLASLLSASGELPLLLFNAKFLSGVALVIRQDNMDMQVCHGLHYLE